jgi:hypothetical protein
MDKERIFNMADTDGRRNEKPLTPEQKEQTLNYAISLGMPEEKISFSEHSLTCYGDGYDFLIIGTDVYTSDVASDVPNDNISWKGVLAHEIVGHRDASLKGLTQKDKVLEEAQASIRAARFATGLSEKEKEILLADAEYRLAKCGVSLESAIHHLNVNER